MPRMPSLSVHPVLAAAAFALLAAPFTTAQTAGPDELRQKLAAKLQKPVFKNAAWLTDYDAARAQAQKDGTLLLIYFGRSYAPCAPCDELEQAVLATEEFAKWSKQVTLCLHVTAQAPGQAPLAEDKHPFLLYELGGNAFPTLSFVDHEGNLLHQVGGGDTRLEQIEASFAELQKWKALRAAVDGGAQAKAQELFLLELRMGNRPFAEMTARAAKFTFDATEQARIAQQLVNLEFTEILRKTPRDQLAQGGKALLPMFEAGRIPDCATDTSYWQYLFEFAGKQRDVALFERLLTSVKQKKAGDARLKRYLQRLEAQLEELKAKKD